MSDRWCAVMGRGAVSDVTVRRKVKTVAWVEIGERKKRVKRLERAKSNRKRTQ